MREHAIAFAQHAANAACNAGVVAVSELVLSGAERGARPCVCAVCGQSEEHCQPFAVTDQGGRCNDAKIAFTEFSDNDALASEVAEQRSAGPE